MNFKKAQPAALWALIVAALGLGGNALYSANSVENLALANEKDIFYEKEMRIVEAAFLEESFRELKQDVKAFQKEMKKETSDIKNLLNQLLLRQVGTLSPPH